MLARSLFMVCANPDIVVERGDELVYCAGALADAYAAIGGEVLYCGKPHTPIYTAALGKAGVLRGGDPPLKRVLAIGDLIRTDLKGAASFGVDCLFVVSGIHAEDFGGRGRAGFVPPGRDARWRGSFAASFNATADVVRARRRP